MSGVFLPLEQPLEIEGRTVLLAVDMVPLNRSDMSDDSIPLPPIPGQPRSWIAEKTIHTLRNAHPDLPVYGAWQVFFTSGRISASLPGTYVFFIDESHRNGYYLSFADNTPYTGSIKQGMPVGAMTHPVNIDGATILDADDLVLPPTPAMTPLEQQASRQADVRRALVLNGSMIFGLILLSIASGIGAKSWLDNTGIALNQARQDVAFMSQQANAFRSAHLVPRTAHYQALLNGHLTRISELFAALDRAFIPRSTLSVPFLLLDHAQGRAAIAAGNRAGELGAVIDSNRYQLTYQPDGVVEVRWNVPTSPDATLDNGELS